MRALLFLGIAGFGAICQIGRAESQVYPWCIEGPATRCSYISFEQCKASIAPNFTCRRNPAYQEPPKTKPKPKRPNH